MRSFVSILFLLIFFHLNGQAWPNNLVFTLKPINGVEFRNNTLGFEVIEESTGDAFIGKFKNPKEAEVAQQRLANVGVTTDMMAFFRTRPIDLEEAKILCANMNATEESTMLSGTSSQVWPGKVMRDTMKIERKETPPKIVESVDNIEDKNAEIIGLESFFVIQLGVFSKTAKHKFQIAVQERVINGMYYCFYGQFSSIDEAKVELMRIKDIGYNDAFITGFDQGNKVSLSVVKNRLNIM